MKKQKLLFFTFLIVSLFFISQVNAISDNDINFSWITSSIYDNNSIEDFDIDNSLSHTTYNNSDYYEHVNDFDGKNYTNEYLNDNVYFDDIEIQAILNFNDSFYLFPYDIYINTYIYQCNYNFNIIQNISNVLNSEIRYIWNVITANGFIYVLGRLTVLGQPYFKIIQLSYDFKFIDVLFESDNSIYYFYNIGFYNDSILIDAILQSTNDAIVLKYDLDGNLLHTYDISSEMNYPLAMTYYKNDDVFYIFDFSGYNIHVYDNSFNYINEISSSINLNNMLIFDDLLFYIDYLYDLYILNVDFTSSSYYPIINYYPNSDGLFDSVDNVNVSLQEQTNPIGNYMGLYSFENLSTNPFYQYAGIDCNTSIIDYLQHKETLQLNDYSMTDYIYTQITFSEQSYGSIEYWTCYSNSNYGLLLWLSKSGTIMNSKIENNILYIRDDTIWDNVANLVQDTWYHFRFDFECSTSNYKGLSQYTYQVYLNNISLGIFDFQNGATPTGINLIGISSYSNQEQIIYIDAIDVSWDTNYYLNRNYQYGIEYNGFWNELKVMNENYQEIISIECLNGTYYINDSTTNFNVFFNESQYVYDTWKINITINQELENGTLFIYNETNSLLFSQDFNTNCSGNIKYVKYLQHYQDTNHFIYLSNFSIESNNTHISGKKGYISYGLDLIDTNVWNFEYSSSLVINAYGRYEIYVSNESYQDSSSLLYQISGFVDFRNEDHVFDLSFLSDIVINPYLIITSMNGQYKLNSIKINGSSSNFILYDDHNNVYLGSLQTSNIDTSQSYFYVLNGKLNYKITFDDDNLEYMKLTFDIEDITNENYQFIHSSYFNSSDTNVLFQIKLKNNDGTYDNIDMGNYYNSEISSLDQDKTTIQLEFLLSDNDLENNANFSGYFSIFSFGYNAQITISTFITSFMIMLLPILIILSLTFGISYVLRKDKTEIVNKSLFFPIFIISSIIVFILGFFDAWILFIMIIATIAYILNRKEELS